MRRLLRWYAEGGEVGSKMLSPSTYLDHAQPGDTYWYLEAVPELSAITSQRFERFSQQHGKQGDAS